MTRQEAQAIAEGIMGGHYECEDAFYSCPLAPEWYNAFDVGEESRECECGRDARVSAIVDALVAAAAPKEVEGC